MHVLLIHQAFSSDKEAGGTRHVELAKHLTGRGHEFTIITSNVSYLTGKRLPYCKGRLLTRQKISDRLNVLYVYTYSGIHKGFFNKILSFLSFMFSSLFVGVFACRDVDIVMGTSPPIFQGVSAYIISRMIRVPFVFEVRDLWPSFAIDMGILRNPSLIKASKWLEKFLYKHANSIIVNSPGFIPHLLECSVPEKKINLIPNSVEVEMFKPDDDGKEIRQNLGLNGKFIVLYAGAHGPANDLNNLLMTAKQLENYGNIAFVLVGDGGERPALIQQAKDMQLQNIHFISAQPKNLMPSFIAAADVCVALLKNIPMFRTVYPNKVFDYMAGGRPTVLGIDGVIREVIENANGGLFAKPGDTKALADSILKLYNDPELCKQQGRNARFYVEHHFNRVDQALKLESVLKSLLDNFRKN